MDPRPNSEARSPAEDCWNTIRGIRMNESLQADISSEERMPGSEARMPGSEETIPGPTSAPAFPRPPPSPRPQARTRPSKSARSRPQTHSPSYPDRAFPPPVPLLGPQAPEPPRGRTRVEWSYFPEPPELRPAPPYHLWHPTTVMFEYLHVRGFLNSGGFGNKEEYYPMVPEHVVQLCRWFNNAKQQDTKKEILVWNDHLHRVDWLKWYWDERERNRARKFVERDELMMEIVQDKILRARELKKEAEREEELMIIAGLDESDKDEDEEEKRELDDIMDLDLNSEGSEEGEIKEKGIHMGNGNQKEQSNANIKEYEAS
ncbi:MAG: hypothetical protein Q9199_001051 [Rusavskia elegans]